jgi:hypothetical protein
LLASQVAAHPGDTEILPLVETANRLGDDEALPRSYALIVSGDDGSSGEYALEVDHQCINCSDDSYLILSSTSYIFIINLV